MKILVTGAAGFIGFHPSKQLLERGDDVVGLDNLNEYYDVTLKHARLDVLKRQKKFKFVKLELADREGMANLFAAEKFARVIHLAAQAGVYDAIVVAVAHKEYVELGASGIRSFGRPNTVIFDIKHVLPKEASNGRL